MIHMRNVKREELNTQLIRKMAPPLGMIYSILTQRELTVRVPSSHPRLR